MHRNLHLRNHIRRSSRLNCPHRTQGPFLHPVACCHPAPHCCCPPPGLPVPNIPISHVTNISGAPAATNTTDYSRSTANRTVFLHPLSGFSALFMCTRAINLGYFIIWIVLSYALVCSHPPQYVTMVRGHLNQIYMNLNSTHLPIPPSPQSIPPKDKPQSVARYPPQNRMHYIYTYCQPITERIANGLPVRFPVTSSHKKSTSSSYTNMTPTPY